MNNLLELESTAVQAVMNRGSVPKLPIFRRIRLYEHQVQASHLAASGCCSVLRNSDGMHLCRTGEN
jgi:hypothetical protein